MAAAALDAPIFRDDDAAREHLEAVRWPNGPVCPHCGVQEFTRLEGEAMLSALARRVATIEITGEPKRRFNNTLRGLDSLPVRITPA